MNRPEWVVANKDEDTIINALTILDFAYNSENKVLNTYRVEGVDYEMVDGVRVLIPRDKAVNENVLLGVDATLTTVDDLYEACALKEEAVEESRKWIYEEQLKIEEAFQDTDKTIAGDGIPNSIYDGFSDIQQHTLYQEYMTMIIIGEWPIEKFDEFVELWYQSGGDEVTERAREWYEEINDN